MRIFNKTDSPVSVIFRGEQLSFKPNQVSGTVLFTSLNDIKYIRNIYSMLEFLAENEFDYYFISCHRLSPYSPIEKARLTIIESAKEIPDEPPKVDPVIFTPEDKSPEIMEENISEDPGLPITEPLEDSKVVDSPPEISLDSEDQSPEPMPDEYWKKQDLKDYALSIGYTETDIAGLTKGKLVELIYAKISPVEKVEV